MNSGDSPENVQLDDRAEFIINKALRWGVFGSLLLIMAGTVFCFCYSDIYGAAGGSADDLHRLVGPYMTFRFTFPWFISGLLHARGQAIIVLGLLLLIATPILRVAIAIVTFAARKDRTSVVMTVIVFLLLVVSFFLGKAG